MLCGPTHQCHLYPPDGSPASEFVGDTERQNVICLTLIRNVYSVLQLELGFKHFAVSMVLLTVP